MMSPLELQVALLIIRAETLRKGTKDSSLKEGTTIVEGMGTRGLIVGN